MPGATGTVLTFPKSHCKDGFTPEAKQWLAVEDNSYIRAKSDGSGTDADVVGLVIDVTSTTVSIVQLGSFVPLRRLGSLLQLQALTTCSGFLSTGGGFSDEPGTGWSRKLFTLPMPPGRLVEASLDTVYVCLEVGTAESLAAP